MPRTTKKEQRTIPLESIHYRNYIITMPDNTRWSVPIAVIARSRAEFYKEEFGNDLMRSLLEDTLPLFEDDEYDIANWAKNNMDWDDVKEEARQIESITVPVDYQEGWMNGEYEIEE